MLHRPRIVIPSVVALALGLGVAAPAFADLVPEPRKKREQKTVTFEPHRPPPLTPPREEPPAKEPPAEVEAPEAKTPEAKPEAKPEASSEAKPESKDAKETKSGSCSIAKSEDGVLGLAALVLLISGASLRRRRA